MINTNERAAARPVGRMVAIRRSPLEAVAGGKALAPIARQPAPGRRVWRVAEAPAPSTPPRRRDLLRRLLRRLAGERGAA